MNRKQFLTECGATCRNWSWSWSFINEDRRLVIFGAWLHYVSGDRCLIFAEDWEFGANGRRKPAFQEAREHIRLVEQGECRLLTFPMAMKEDESDSDAPAEIDYIVPELTLRGLLRKGGSWFSVPFTPQTQIPEEITSPTYQEGAVSSITVNAFERNRKARQACIAHYGAKCVVCGFEAKARYGELVDGLIHVHHIVPLSQTVGEYRVDPIKDLRPLCPNCHAAIHYPSPSLTIEELRAIVQQSEGAG